MADGDAAFLIDGSWKIGYFQENNADNLEDFALSYVPGNGDRKATDLVGGISMGYYITKKAWDDPEKRDAAVKFVEHMTSDEVVSVFATTSVTALKNGVIPSDDLDVLQLSLRQCQKHRYSQDHRGRSDRFSSSPAIRLSASEYLFNIN